MSGLVQVQAGALSVPDVLASVTRPSCGGIGLFIGVVRDHDHPDHDHPDHGTHHGTDPNPDRLVTGLSYEAHPRARDVLAELVARAERGDGTPAVTAASVVHRTGDLVVGDLAVVVATSAPHRADALATCRWLIDAVKEHTPIWKRQTFVDGAEEWVGIGDCGPHSG